MRVNDGTVSTPPRQFIPSQQAIDISTLPPAPAILGAAPNQPLSSYPAYGNQSIFPAGGFVPAQPAGAVHPVSTQGMTGGSGAVTMAGWTAHASSSSKQAGSPDTDTEPAIAGQTGGYGYQSDYSWLKGRLEYSATARRWKLRYIPRDASEHKIDDFGGSVVLTNIDLLQGFAPGEFVRVEGRLTGQDGTVVDFAPTYQLARIERQTQ
jgi:hypothetical protein